MPFGAALARECSQAQTGVEETGIFYDAIEFDAREALAECSATGDSAI